MAKKRKKRAPTLLEQLVARESAETLSASASLAIRKIAEDIAREALEAPGFREDLRRSRQRALDAGPGSRSALDADALAIERTIS